MKAVFPALDGFGLAIPDAPEAVDAKRVLDLAVASLLVVLLAPLLALLTLAIAIDSRGPVLFCQRRTGLNGQTFGIFKFRSMHVMEDGADVTQATAGDVRVTRVGRVIRKLSLDELPQLFNVIAGDMSLVGPRPHALAHDDYYGAAISNYALRQEVKPYNIRTTIMSPGAVATELTEKITDPDFAKTFHDFYEKVAISPENFARMVAFAIGQPEDVDINEILFRPTAQDF